MFSPFIKSRITGRTRGHLPRGRSSHITYTIKIPLNTQAYPEAYFPGDTSVYQAVNQHQPTQENSGLLAAKNSLETGNDLGLIVLLLGQG